MKRHLLVAVSLLSSCWILSACPQAANAPFGGRDTVSASDPIDPKGDHPTVDRPHELEPHTMPGADDSDGSTGSDGSDEGDQPPSKISGKYIPHGPLEVKPFVHARLRYGKDAKILAKSPAASYVISEKTKKIALSFGMEVTWETNPSDDDWVAIVDGYDNKPQLRVVYIPNDDSHDVFYSDADWVADADGDVVYSFPGLSVADGGTLRFFMKETKSPDFHSGNLIPLPSGDPSKPFPTDGDEKTYKLGAFQMKAIVYSTTPEPIRQSDGLSLPLKF